MNKAEKERPVAIVILEEGIRARLIKTKDLTVIEIREGCIDKIRVIPVKKNFRYKIKEIKNIKHE